MKHLTRKDSRNEIKGGDMDGRGGSTAIRPGIFLFFSNEKERKLCKKRTRKRRRGRGVEGGWCLTFFKGIINSLSALVIILFFVLLFFILSFFVLNILFPFPFVNRAKCFVKE